MNKKGELLWSDLAFLVALLSLLVILILYTGDLWQILKDLAGSLF